MKKIVSLLICILLLSVSVAYAAPSGGSGGGGQGGGGLPGSTPEPVPAPSSGVCGDALVWTLDNNGLLLISGTGDMTNYTQGSEEIPWYLSQEDIKTIIITEGVTSIGTAAFSDCSALKTVCISTTVETIGEAAFADCTELKEIAVPNSVTAVGAGAFADCVRLRTIFLSSGMTDIRENTFSGCRRLGEIVIPSSMTNISENAFADSSGLTVVYGGNEEQWLGVEIGEGNDILLEEAVIDYNGYDIYTRTTGVTLNESVIELPVQLSQRLMAEIEPDNAYYWNVYWVSSDESVAIVSQDGWVTVLSEGNATITAYTVDGAYAAECEVSAVAAEVDIDGDSKTTTDDALYLFKHLSQPDIYTLGGSGDVNGDGETDNNDVVYILKHIMLSENYPINSIDD